MANQQHEEAIEENTTNAIGGSAALISVCVITSRITGFVRTWAMAWALGATFLASSYQVANNLPNMLYELAVGGMLVTAFLPVYVSVRKRLGKEAGNAYASNLLSITVVFLGIIAILCSVFSAQLIFTQSFMSNQETMDTSVFFFRFFAIQIVFYGGSAILSGLLNANRDYLWSSIAPAFNNIIVIITFVAYALVAPSDPSLALWIIAIGNPLGVLVQMCIQIPALKRNGIKLTFRINFKDPALRETLSIGIPALLVMIMSYCIVSVQNAVALGCADNGPSVMLYARLWFTLPYAFLATPITTAMFTELAEMNAAEASEDFRRGIADGTRQIIFLTTPFVLYLAVFSLPLVTLYHAGSFTQDNVVQVALYLVMLSLSLPFYSVNTYLQKIFSALMQMKLFAKINFVCAAVQIGFTLLMGGFLFAHTQIGLEFVALGELVFYLCSDAICFAYLRKRFGNLELMKTGRSLVQGLGLGALGAGVGLAIMAGIAWLWGGFNFTILQAVVLIVAGGIPALLITFGLAIKLKVPGADFIEGLLGKVLAKLGR